MANSIQLKNIKGENIFPVVLNEGLQSINKQVTIPTGSTVASVTLDTDKYAGAFYNCGLRTQTGEEELEQIPSDWK